MKNILCIAFILFAISCSAQTKKTDSIAVTQSYVITLSESEIRELYNFILKADLWSDKGKQQYLEALDKKVILHKDTIKIRHQ